MLDALIRLLQALRERRTTKQLQSLTLKRRPTVGVFDRLHNEYETLSGTQIRDMCWINHHWDRLTRRDAADKGDNHQKP